MADAQIPALVEIGDTSVALPRVANGETLSLVNLAAQGGKELFEEAEISDLDYTFKCLKRQYLVAVDMAEGESLRDLLLRFGASEELPVGDLNDRLTQYNHLLSLVTEDVKALHKAFDRLDEHSATLRKIASLGLPPAKRQRPLAEEEEGDKTAKTAEGQEQEGDCQCACDGETVTAPSPAI